MTTCRCHDPAVFGHRSDCPFGHRYVEHWLIGRNISEGIAAKLADDEQQWLTAPLRLEGS
jgi:hypothetical protein